MSSLTYRGKLSTAAREPVVKSQIDVIMAGGLARSYVDAKVIELATPKARKDYVDGQDQQFAPVGYYQSRDALLIPNSQKGAANGVASLDPNGDIPAAQIPNLGDGSWKGPWGITTRTTQSVVGNSARLKIAQWDIGVQNINNYWPMVFMNVFTNGTNSNGSSTTHEGKSIIEVCHGSTYSAANVVASGMGVSYFGFRPVIVFPSIFPGSSPATSFVGSTNTVLTAWLRTPFADNTVEVTDVGFIEGSAFLMRVT